MKKTFLYISIAILAAVSCTKEAMPVQRVDFRVFASTESKVTVSNMAWEAGDQISVYLVSAAEKSVLPIVNATSGEFAGTIPSPQETDTYYATYPAVDFDGAKALFNIPSVQSGVDQMHPSLVASYTGAKASAAFHFAPVVALLEINTDKPVTKVVFSSLDGTLVSGDFKYDFTNGLEATQTSSSTITYEGTATQKVKFLVPAIKLNKGYMLEMTGSEGTMYGSFYANSGVDLGQNKNNSVTISDLQPCQIQAAMDAAPATSFSVFKSQGADAANKIPWNQFSGATFKVTLQGISSPLVKCGYSVDGGDDVAIEANLVPTETPHVFLMTIPTATVSTYGNHKIKGYAQFGETKVYSNELEFTITGIPQRIETTGSTPAGWTTDKTIGLNILSGTRMTFPASKNTTTQSYAISPAFFVPEDINIVSTVSCYAYGGSIPGDFNDAKIYMNASESDDTSNLVMSWTSGVNKLDSSAFGQYSTNLTLKPSVKCISLHGTTFIKKGSWTVSLSGGFGIPVRYIEVSYR